jgi:2'-5' RNA ligase
MRLFTAIDPPVETTGRLDALLKQLRAAANLRWSRAENLHITTKFIGEWPQERIEELRTALSSIPMIGEIQVSLRGVGYFPNPHQPRVFWIAVHASDSLGTLAHLTDEVTAGLGVAREGRSYSPHLTLARLNARNDPPGALGALRRAVASLPDPDCGAFTVRDWHLYLSEPGPGGSRYTRMETFSLI